MKDLSHVPQGNLPEIVWNHLKIIASEAAGTDADPLLEECVAHVEAVVLKVIGRADALPAPVVAFYAQELVERISSLRQRTGEADS